MEIPTDAGTEGVASFVRHVQTSEAPAHTDGPWRAISERFVAAIRRFVKREGVRSYTFSPDRREEPRRPCAGEDARLPHREAAKPPHRQALPSRGLGHLFVRTPTPTTHSAFH